MRFSLASAVAAALPLLASAESPFEQYQAQFSGFVNNFGSKLPNPSRYDPAEAAAAKAGPKKMDILTLGNWKDTLYSAVKPGSAKPTEWWVLVTGGNKTCLGHCGTVEAAFNETATFFASTHKHKKPVPHVGYINCEQQPILCNSWGAGTGRLWIFDMLPKPAPVDVFIKRLNLTDTTKEDLVELWQTGAKTDFTKYEGAFHPFDGWVVEKGLAVPYGWVMWIFNLLPNWAFMLIISFVSRTMMSRRMNNFEGGAGGPPPAAAPAGGAAPAS